MLKLSNFLSGLSSRSLLFLLAFSGTLLLAGCSNPLSLLTGGGPNVAANVQAGATNSQTIGTTELQETTLTIKDNTGGVVTQTQTTTEATSVTADRVDTVVVNEVPVWVILLLILGWLFPSPNEIGRWVRDLLSRQEKTP